MLFERIGAIALMVSFLVPSFASEKESSLQQIIDRCTEAAGGRKAIEAVKAIQFELNIKEPKFEVKGVYKADRKRRMRIDIFADEKRVYTEAYDGKEAWQQNQSGEVKLSTPEGTAALWHGIVTPGKLYGWHEQHSIGNRPELAGREMVEGINYYVLKLTLSDGYSNHYYVNPANWLVERTREMRALHPDVDPAKKWIETRFSDFRKVDGILRAFQSVNVELKTDQVLQTTVITGVQINPELEDSLFSRP